MTLASKLVLDTGTVPATPAAGQNGLYVDSSAVAPGVRVLDSSGNIYTLDLVRPSTNDFRLTGVTATPVMTADASSLSTIYLTPYKGNQIALYNGTTWDLISSAEVSLAVTGRTTDLPFDIFAYNNAGVVTLEFLNWTNATTRATALVRQDGVWCKTGALTRRYVGSCRARSATTYSWVTGTAAVSAKLDLFNADNRVKVGFGVTTSTDTWDYMTAIWRQPQGNTNRQVDIMVGLQEEIFTTDVKVTSRNLTISMNRYVGVGNDSTSTPMTGIRVATTNTVASTIALQSASVADLPSIGRHYYAWLEYSVAAGICTWLGDTPTGAPVQSGMTGTWTC